MLVLIVCGVLCPLIARLLAPKARLLHDIADGFFAAAVILALLARDEW
ncbi:MULTISPECIES: hypothetical protein [Streptomyces]